MMIDPNEDDGWGIDHEEVEARLRNATPDLRTELLAEAVDPSDLISVLNEHGLFVIQVGDA